MFRQSPRLWVNFYFPTIGSTEAPMREASTKCVDEYLASVWDRLRTALWEAQTQSMVEVHWQKWYYDWKIGAVGLKPGNLVLVKADAFKGKSKIKDRWEEDTCEVVHQIMTGIPSNKVMDQCRRTFICHQSWLLLIASKVGIPLCIGIHHAWDRCTSPTPCKPTSLWWCHKRVVVVWSPTALPARLLWGGLMRSYDFYCGHLPEHPLKMGEYLR